MKSVSFFSVLLLITLTISCQKRYWFRTKIDLAGSKKYSVKVTVENRSPEFISQEFVDVMRKESAKQLKRKGFFELPIDSPQYHFNLVLFVDSFNSAVRSREKNAAFYAHVPQRNAYRFKHTVKAIFFNCKLTHYKQGWTQWEAKEDIYYFGESRDLGRGVGVVKYLIRTAK